jgi:hypothetical protein
MYCIFIFEKSSECVTASVRIGGCQRSKRWSAVEGLDVACVASNVSGCRGERERRRRRWPSDIEGIQGRCSDPTVEGGAPPELRWPMEPEVSDWEAETQPERMRIWQEEDKGRIHDGTGHIRCKLN